MKKAMDPKVLRLDLERSSDKSPWRLCDMSQRFVLQRDWKRI